MICLLGMGTFGASLYGASAEEVSGDTETKNVPFIAQCRVDIDGKVTEIIEVKFLDRKAMEHLLSIYQQNDPAGSEKTLARALSLLFSGATDIGKAVFLTAAGAFSLTAPTTTNYANVRVGMVQSTTKIDVRPEVMGIY